MNCRHAARRLPALVDPTEPADLELHRHLRRCAGCQARVGEYRELKSLLGTLEPDVGTLEPDLGEGAAPARNARVGGIVVGGSAAGLLGAAAIVLLARRLGRSA